MMSSLKILLNRLKRKIRPLLLNSSGLNETIKSENIKPSILIASSSSSNWSISSFDHLIAQKLAKFTSKINILVCDEFLNACHECDNQWLDQKDLLDNKIKKKICNDCYKPGIKEISKKKIKYIKFSDYYEDVKLNSKENEIINNHARAGTLRYLGKGEIENKIERNIYSQYLKSATLTMKVVKKIHKTINPDIIICHHGIYVPQGVITDFFHNVGKETVTWIPSYKKNTFLFNKGRSYHFTMPYENDGEWQNFMFEELQNKKLVDYLVSRKKGDNDWISFSKKKTNAEKLKKLKKNKNTAVLFTNVVWDAQVHFKENFFPSMLQWLFFTIDFYINNPKKNLIVRIHPAEIYGSVPSNQKVFDEINKRYNALPENIIIIKPDEEISTYDLFDLTNNFLIYSTKTGIELAARGKNVVVCGEAWCKNKGFTIDPKSTEEYLEILNKLDNFNLLDKKKTFLARKYAYYIFFKRMIPVKSVYKPKFLFSFKVKKNAFEEKDDGLDFIIRKILDNSQFVFDEN